MAIELEPKLFFFKTDRKADRKIKGVGAIPMSNNKKRVRDKRSSR